MSESTPILPPDEELGPSDEETSILRWRISQLRGLGFQEDDAISLACDFHVDLGESRQLIGAGCPHDLAARILS